MSKMPKIKNNVTMKKKLLIWIGIICLLLLFVFNLFQKRENDNHRMKTLNQIENAINGNIGTLTDYRYELYKKLLNKRCLDKDVMKILWIKIKNNIFDPSWNHINYWTTKNWCKWKYWFYISKDKDEILITTSLNEKWKWNYIFENNKWYRSSNILKRNWMLYTGPDPKNNMYIKTIELNY